MADTNDEDQTAAEGEEAAEAEAPAAEEESAATEAPLEGDVVDDAAEAEASADDDGVDISQPAVAEQPVARAELSDLTPTTDAYSRDNLDLILNVKVTLSMEVGSTHIPIRRLLQLTQGSVVELDQMAGQPMNVLVNGTHIAQGEVVLVNDRVGIRLTDVISPSERVKSIN